MNTVKLENVSGGYEYVDPDWRVSAWDTPSGTGITCQVFTRHYPYTSVCIRGLESIDAAEAAANHYIMNYIK
jgi:hypothetical protein